MTDELERRRKGIALGHFQEKLSEVCEEESEGLYYAEMIGVLVLQILDLANEEIEVNRS